MENPRNQRLLEKPRQHPRQPTTQLPRVPRVPRWPSPRPAAAVQSPSQVIRKLKPMKEEIQLNQAKPNRTFQPCGIRRTSHATKKLYAWFSDLDSNSHTILGPMMGSSSRSLSSRMPALSFQIMLLPRRASLSTHRAPMLPASKCCLLLKGNGLEHTRTISFFTVLELSVSFTCHFLPRAHSILA